ncbi:MAG: hypothetical protein H6727_09410 [Myxococcales bacterium]|nr:hypothetical protein [Myxococcales bacterium]
MRSPNNPNVLIFRALEILHFIVDSLAKQKLAGSGENVFSPMLSLFHGAIELGEFLIDGRMMPIFAETEKSKPFQRVLFLAILSSDTRE